MIKTIPTIPRLLAMIGFALLSFGALLFLWLAFGGPIPFHAKGYRFNVMFPKAAQLTRQADVRISGVSVGKVVALESDPNNATRATIELDARYAPIPKASKAMLRTKTLLGETYVEIAPNRKAGTGPLIENATLPRASVSDTVDLDELLKAFDPKTRDAFRVWMQSGAAAARGRGADINQAFGELPGFAEEFDELAATLDAQDSSVRQVISGTADFFDAISRRDHDLRTLMTAGNKTFTTIGERNTKLAAIFQQLPRFEQESTKTLPQLTKLAEQGLPIVQRLQAVASELTPTFEALNELSPEFQGFFERLGPVITASEDGLPAFDRILMDLPKSLNAFVPFTRTLNPLLRTIDQGKQDLTSFVANFTA
ncbi:MAG: MlaD family protein, partial [Actinomycetota bacterium]|nr:MlaD family protein [Actinomycetota bacterium]